MADREKTEQEKQADAIARNLAASVEAGDYDTAAQELEALKKRLEGSGEAERG